MKRYNFDSEFLRNMSLDTLPDEVKAKFLGDLNKEMYKRAAMKVGMPGRELHLVYFDKIFEAVFEEIKTEVSKERYVIQDYFTAG